MNEVQIDPLGTPVIWSSDKPETAELVQTWPQDRYLIGWSPWIGYGKGAQLESHLELFHEDVSIFVRGPHKEASFVMYDEAKVSEFFPAGYGRLVKKGEKIRIEFLVSNTQPGMKAGGQANVRIFSVLVT